MFRLSGTALLIGTASVLAAAGRPSPSQASVAEAKAALAQLPLRFEANRGQLSPAVRFSAHSAGYDLYLTDHGASLAFKAHQIDLSLVNSNRSPKIEAVDRTATRTDFFRGTRANWRTDVPSYSRVRYTGVYRGIDMVYYGNQNQLEFDFVLQPGADPDSVRMKFSSSAHVSLTPEGDLVLNADGSSFVQKRPFVYQTDPKTSLRHQVKGSYTLLGDNTVGLKLEQYDRSRTLVVDPVITYLSYLGGAGTDQINAVKLGPNGLLYIVGQTDTVSLPGAGYQSSPAGLTDIWISVLDTKVGNGLVYASYLGGTAIDIPNAIDVDSSGALYITGSTTSTDFPVTSNASKSTGAATALDAFVVKLDYTQADKAALIYSSYFGGNTGDEVGNGIAVQANGLVDVIGTTKSTDLAVTPSAYAGVMWGSQDMFLAQVDTTVGGLTYCTYLGGEGLDYGKSVVAGSNGLVYFAASTLSQLFPMAGFNYSLNPFGAQDIIIGAFDLTKSGSDSLVYSTYFGGSGNDEVSKIALDAKGNLLVTGYTLSSDYPTTPDAMQRTYGGNADAFIAVVNTAKTFQSFIVYSTFLGGGHTEVGYDVAGDPAGSIYVTGYTLSPDFPTANAIQPGWASGIEIFLTKFTPGVAGRGAIQYSTYLGLSSIYVPSGLAVAADGTVYLVGYAGVGLSSTDNALQSGGFAGSTDGFLITISK